MRSLAPAHMTCRETMRTVQAFLDEECEPADAWEVARHLSRCEECFADAETFRRVKRAVANLRVAPDATAIRRLRRLLASIGDAPA